VQSILLSRVKTLIKIFEIKTEMKKQSSEKLANNPNTAKIWCSLTYYLLA